MTLLEILKLKWFSTYLLNASLKGLDHFILMNSYNNIIGDCIILHEYTNTRIHEYVYSYNDIIGDRIILLHEYTNT